MFILFFPPFAAGLAVVCIYLAFRHAPEIRWGYLLIGGLLLGSYAGVIILMTGNEVHGSLYATIEVFFSVFIALIGGVILVALLPGKRKIIGGIVLVTLPVMSIGGGLLGDHYSKINRDSDMVIEALNEYKAQHGEYPETLEELVPAYIEDLRNPKTTWGWLYQTSGDQFTLGYVYWVDKIGYSVCIRGDQIPDWECLPNSTGPFELGPTPMPQQDDR